MFYEVMRSLALHLLHFLLCPYFPISGLCEVDDALVKIVTLLSASVNIAVV